jgi:hypothetical protein
MQWPLLPPYERGKREVTDLLITVLRRPDAVRGFSEFEWELLVRQSRAALLLGRIGSLLDAHGLLGLVPAAAARHFDSARMIVANQQRATRWEAVCVEKALANIDTPIVLLKGAAYAVAGLPAADGRFMSDIDILVARDRLPEVEAALMQHGWVSSDEDPYNQRYYRTWMHELPPMRHRRRGTVIDVHHALLPQTARSHPESDKLFAAAQPLLKNSRLKTLAPADMILHCATHLFHDGELEHGLRDLVDLDSLLRHFGGEPGFWSALVPRAIELDLARSLFYGLHYARRMLGTAVPEQVLAALSNSDTGKPGAFKGRLLDQLFCRALRPAHVTTSDRLTPLARWLLYVRAHWLRMPPGLLAVHLIRKALVRSEPAA